MNFQCQLECEETFIPCGHKCTKKCHEKSDHTENCYFQCKKVLLCGHLCPLKCSQVCVSTCKVPIDVQFEDCLHINSFPCHQVIKKNGLKCNTIVNIDLECGHVWSNKNFFFI